MINRELIRQKVVQLMYARYTGENKTLSGLEKELERSLDNAYELYLSLLSRPQWPAPSVWASSVRPTVWSPTVS